MKNETKCKFCGDFPADYGRGFCSDTCELEAEVREIENAEYEALQDWGE